MAASISSAPGPERKISHREPRPVSYAVRHRPVAYRCRPELFPGRCKSAGRWRPGHGAAPRIRLWIGEYDGVDESWRPVAAPRHREEELFRFAYFIARRFR